MNSKLGTILSLVALYLITFLCLWTSGNWPLLALCAGLAPPLLWLSVTDLETYIIPDIATLTVVSVSFTYLVFIESPMIWLHVATGLLVTACFWLLGSLFFSYSNRDGLGIGDAKLFGAGALLLGPLMLPELILLSCVGGIIGYVVSNLLTSATKQGIPFGPFIAYSIFALSLQGNFFI